MRPVFEKFEDFIKDKKIILEGEEKTKEEGKIKKIIKNLKKKIKKIIKKENPEEENEENEESLNSYYRDKKAKFYFDPQKKSFVYKYIQDGNYKIFEIPPSEEAEMRSDADLRDYLMEPLIKYSKEHLDLSMEKMRKNFDEMRESVANSIIDPILDIKKNKKNIPKILGKNIIDLKSTAQIQSLLSKLGYLKSKAGPLGNGITCYFNGETEKAFEKLTGKKFINLENPDDISVLKNSIYQKDSLVVPGKVQEISKNRNESLNKIKKRLKPYIDPGEISKLYDQQWEEGGGYDYKLKLTGDIIGDMYQFNSVKEGGLSDSTKDTGPSKDPCPYEFDCKTGILKFEGKNYNLKINPHLKDSISSITGTSSSNRWHTSRGIIWPVWKSSAPTLGIKDPLEIAKGFFEMKDENAKKIYELNFYNKHIKDKGLETKSVLVNHCMGNSMWGSLNHGKKTIENTKNTLKKYGYNSLDDAIEKIGDKFVTEIMLMEQYNLFSGYPNSETYLKGWTNGLLNFHRYFIPKYSDLPEKIEFPKEYKNREDLGSNGYANLENMA